MRDIDVRDLIDIGYQGENLAQTIEYDVGAWQEQYPQGTFAALYIRPGDDEIYPVSIRVKGSVLRWTVTAYETERAGIGGLEIRLMVGSLIKKSALHLTECRASLSRSEGDPSVRPGWVEEVLATGAAAAQSASAAEQSRQTAALKAQAAAQSAEAAQQSADDAADGAQAAAASVTAAQAAVTAAEAAQAEAVAAAKLAVAHSVAVYEADTGLIIENLMSREGI